jgi:hypothetical protein
MVYSCIVVVARAGVQAGFYILFGVAYTCELLYIVYMLIGNVEFLEGFVILDVLYISMLPRAQ